ncbi:MAG: TIGR03862 family flavoprotein [Candidatus Obscuribacterales bacterium]|nr:TIGR03862 family flavoprotein [Candidatus Obscuribacterales bacterium]
MSKSVESERNKKEGAVAAPIEATSSKARTVAVIGGGPAGLIAAEELSKAGLSVDVYEAMPTLGRKFLRAGLGGLNITHSEPFEKFCSRYFDRQPYLQPFLDCFKPEALRNWVHELGITTFVGSSGRVFPAEMKSAPLLRAWVHRLRSAGVRLHVGHRFLGFADAAQLKIAGPEGEFLVAPDVVVLALGGASWPQLGSDGAWVSWLVEKGVQVLPWQSANCGFELSWSEHLLKKHSGAPLKSVSMTFTDLDGTVECKRGELLIADYGVEGSLVYAFSRKIRECLRVRGEATIYLDLYPDRSFERLLSELSKARGSRSLSRHLQACLGRDELKRALLFELCKRQDMEDPKILAGLAKALPLHIAAPRPLAEAISTAGGVSFDSVDSNLMLKDLPGVFVAGEMLDWEAPTGGYLLTACFATGLWAGRAAASWAKGESLL